MTSAAGASQKFAHVLFVADVGSHSSFHVGDEAMLECNLLMFRRLLPAAQFTVVSLDPATTRELYGTAAVPRLGFSDVSSDRQAELERIDHWVDSAKYLPNSLPDALQTLLEADLLVISGGGNLSSTWPEHILERLALVRLAKARRTPVLILGQTIGPGLIDYDKQLVAEILNSADWLGLREANSVALALSLGVPLERIDYQLDDAITLLPAPSPLLPSSPSSKRNGPLIGLTLHPVFALDSPNNWLNFLAAELDRVIEATSGHVLFIPHLRTMENGRDTGDRAIGQALARLLQNPATMTVADVSSSAETLWLTQQADVVISTRYHPLVFALTKAIPCLGLPTDHYTLIKLHGALSHANRESDLVFLNENRWEGLAERIIELCQVRHYSLIQREAWEKLLKQTCLAREACLGELLEGLANTAQAAIPMRIGSTTLIKALAKIVDRPKLFSASAAREALLQGVIEHWQVAAQEAEKYVFDLKRTLQLKNSEIEALIHANHSASVAIRELSSQGVIEHWQTAAQEAEKYASDLKRTLQLKNSEIEALVHANHSASAAIREASTQGIIEHWQTAAQEAEKYALDLKRILHLKSGEIESLREALNHANHSASAALTREASSQDIIEHWQTTAQEAERYALDLRRVLHLKDNEINSLTKP
ncbi:MAG: polysaccharide pyruvyl transferase family protein [Pseudomonadota bacterium]